MNKIAKELVKLARELMAGGYSLGIGNYSHNGRNMAIYSYDVLNKYEALAKKMGGKVKEDGFVLDDESEEVFFAVISFSDEEEALAYHQIMDEKGYWKRDVELDKRDRRYFPKTKYVDWKAVIEPTRDEVLSSKMAGAIFKNLESSTGMSWSVMGSGDFRWISTRDTEHRGTISASIYRDGLDAKIKVEHTTYKGYAEAGREILGVKKFRNVVGAGARPVAKWIARLTKKALSSTTPNIFDPSDPFGER